MSRATEKQVKVIKRSERQRSFEQRQTPAAISPTAAQKRREIVSTIVSWINDRKNPQAGAQPVCGEFS